MRSKTTRNLIVNPMAKLTNGQIEKVLLVKKEREKGKKLRYRRRNERVFPLPKERQEQK